jgi:CRISPR associated protein Cas1
MIYPKNIKYLKLLHLNKLTKIIKITQNWVELSYNDKIYKINYINLLGIVMNKNIAISFEDFILLCKYCNNIYLINSRYELISTISSTANIPSLIVRQVQLDSLNIAKLIVKNKINNQIHLCGKKLKSNFEVIDNMQQLMLLEGRASSSYFRIMFEQFNWKYREPRARSDKINLLLDIGYFHLYILVNTLIVCYGLSPNIGFLHSNQENKNSLSLDLMEVFRSDIDSEIIKYLKKFGDVIFVFKDDKCAFELFEDSQEYLKIINEKLLLLKPRIAKFVYHYRLFLLGKCDFPVYIVK